MMKCRYDHEKKKIHVNKFAKKSDLSIESGNNNLLRKLNFNHLKGNSAHFIDSLIFNGIIFQSDASSFVYKHKYLVNFLFLVFPSSVIFR